MNCDVCAKKCAPYELVCLLSSYKTKQIEWICPECEREVSLQLDRLRSLYHGWIARMLKVWIRNKRRKKYTKEAKRDE